MKKEKALKNFLSKHPTAQGTIIKSKVQGLERGSFYVVERESINEIREKHIIQLGHFYKDGIRVKLLSIEFIKNPELSYLRSKRIKNKKLYRTLRYMSMRYLHFKKINLADLPLYLNGSTPLLQECLKNLSK